MAFPAAAFHDLQGRGVLISGGGSGIGAALVEAFARQGARVAFIDIAEAESRALVERLAKDCAFAPVFLRADLRDAHSLAGIVDQAAAAIGGIRVLVNNAARDDRHDWRDVTVDYWDERAATNIRHMFFAIQAVAPDMIAAGGGSIVNMGSVSWMMPQGGFPAYTTSKSAVHGLTRNMARDLGPHRIRVNTVVPGWIMTERQKQLWLTPEALEAHRDRQCLKDMIEPVYVARMAVFLASDDAAMCTAQDFLVEAGTI